MKNIISAIVILCCLQTVLSAQTTATWQGGTPGRATDWNCPNNWKEGNIPDEYSQVIIPANRNTYPVIKQNVTPIDALLLEGGATLKLEQDAYLTILGGTGRFNGLTLIGKIYNEGTFTFEATADITNSLFYHIVGNGTVIDSSNATAFNIR